MTETEAECRAAWETATLHAAGFTGFVEYLRIPSLTAEEMQTLSRIANAPKLGANSPT